jgi:hypothetical protein
MIMFRDCGALRNALVAAALIMGTSFLILASHDVANGQGCGYTPDEGILPLCDNKDGCPNGAGQGQGECTFTNDEVACMLYDYDCGEMLSFVGGLPLYTPCADGQASEYAPPC